ncbi:MAG: hypothetical protein VW475_09925, partial [Curvibacter sp.]
MKDTQILSAFHELPAEPGPRSLPTAPLYDACQVGVALRAVLFVEAAVVSRPAADRVVLDCGSKTLTSDAGRGFDPLPGHGWVFTGPDDTTPDRDIL